MVPVDAAALVRDIEAILAVVKVSGGTERLVRDLRAVVEGQEELHRRGQRAVDDCNAVLQREERLWHAANTILGRLGAAVPTSLPDDCVMRWTSNGPTVGEILTLHAALAEGPHQANARAVALLRPEVREFAHLMEARLKEVENYPALKGAHPRALVEYLDDKVDALDDKLRAAFSQRTPDCIVAVGQEAADVAVLALLVADAMGAILRKPKVVADEQRDQDQDEP